MNRHLYVVHCGDIGEPLREGECEPLTLPAITEPVRTPEPAPAEPEKVPA